MNPPAIEGLRIALPHGIELSCRVAGDPAAPTLLFLHGFPEAAFAWDEVMRRLAPRYRCVAPDQRGYGSSSRPAAVEAYRPKHLVADIAALIGVLGAPVRGLVAHDWGGAVAWNLAAQQPALLERLVMLNAPHPATFLRELRDNPAQQAASAYMPWLCRPGAEAVLAEDDFRRLFRMLAAGHGAGGDADQDRLPAWLDEPMRARYREVWSAGLDGALNWYRASPLRPPTPEHPGAAALQLDDEAVTVRVPTCLLWGEADIALLPALLDGLERWVPRLDLRRVPGASHWIVHERPQLVVETIEGFVGGG